MGLIMLSLLKLAFAVFLMHSLFQDLDVNFGRVDKEDFGILCLFVLLKLVLFRLVIQTVLYMECKSYHHKSIDKSDLSGHQQVYHLRENLVSLIEGQGCPA